MAELYEIAFAIESQRESIARALAGAVHERQEQARQERQERRERRSSQQDRHADVLKQTRRPGIGTAGAKVPVTEARASACISARFRTATDCPPIPARNQAPLTAPSHLAPAAGQAFWT